MNFIKKSFTLLLTVMVCLNLFACRSVNNDLAVDWRAKGTIDGYGTITRTDEGSVDVLVTISSENVAFYRDKPEQTLFDRIPFPMKISDAEQAFNAISFDDLDGDGESDVIISFIHKNGDNTEMVWIWDSEERYVFRGDLSTIKVGGNDINTYIGIWEYIDNLWLRIYEDATWEFVDDQENLIEYGTLWVSETGVTLYFNGSGNMLQLDRTVSGDLIDIVNGTTLIPVEEIQSSEPCFTRNGLTINAAMNEGVFYLENGVCSHTSLGDGYNIGDCYWEVIKNTDYTHDGIRKIEFNAICYIPEYAIPDFDEQYLTNVDCELYDFYTGMWFTAAPTFGSSTRSENYYLHTVIWRGNSYLIEFFYSTDWQHNVGDWAVVFTKSYVVYLPEDYDGLIFAAESQPDNYEDSATRMQLDALFPEANIMGIDTVDPYSNLYFSICCSEG
ncbi:MAG: hypothetical protein ACOX17_07695 [Christensenellales bacterium]|jgi:hypothetical protein